MNTTHTPCRPSAGFTLTELVVVIAIIAIFGALAIPSYKGVTAQNRIASEIGDLNGDIELARSAAIKQGVTVTICAAMTTGMSAATAACSADATGWNAGWIVFTDVGGTNGASNQAYAAAGTGDTLLRIHPPLSGKDAVFTTPTTLAALTFNRMGGTSNAGTLSLHDPDGTVAWYRCLVVSEVGLSALNTATSGPNPGTCP
ncbi:MAG: GspH/FimT family pseudopilin [Rhodanobacter sp.]